MKAKNNILSLGLGAAVLFWAGAASADNITVFDTLDPKGIGKGYEDNEVEINCEQGQKWDLEAFLFDLNTKKLAIQGGFDFKNGVSDWRPLTYYSGDIFIDVDGNFKWPNQLAGSGTGGYATELNSKFGWDYAIAFERKTGYGNEGGPLTGNYTVYQLSGATDVLVYFGANYESNPFRYLSGGSVPVTSAPTSGSVSQWEDNPAGASGGTHYVLGNIDLSFLQSDPNYEVGKEIYFHYTYGCGNDVIMGKTYGWSIADGGFTVALLGFSLSALGFASRRLGRTR
ncbi:MAG: hypothetical protein GX456_02135 [Verrucomicrobia bacterium]|nr:hypothetical protein [Verrucomicrobiota bacterium]